MHGATWSLAGRRLGKNLVGCAAAALFSFSAIHAAAQEDVNSPPPPLQWPTLTSEEIFAPPGSRGQLKFVVSSELGLRKTIETEADKSLTGTPARWSDGARPTECGRGCLGAPFVTQTRFLDRPNSRIGLALGRLEFVAPVGPFERRIIFSYRIEVECRIPGAGKEGNIFVTVKVDPGYIEDAGIGESIADFFLGPVDLSRRIEAVSYTHLTLPTILLV